MGGWKVRVFILFLCASFSRGLALWISSCIFIALFFSLDVFRSLSQSTASFSPSACLAQLSFGSAMQCNAMQCSLFVPPLRHVQGKQQ